MSRGTARQPLPRGLCVACATVRLLRGDTASARFFCRLEMRCINTDIVAAQPRRHPGRPDHPAARAKGPLLSRGHGMFPQTVRRCCPVRAAQPRRHPGRPDHPAARAKGVLGGVVARLSPAPWDRLSRDPDRATTSPLSGVFGVVARYRATTSPLRGGCRATARQPGSFLTARPPRPPRRGCRATARQPRSLLR